MSFKNGYRYQPDWQYAWRRIGVSQPGCLQPLSWHYLVECSTVYGVWQERLKQHRPRLLRLHQQRKEELFLPQLEELFLPLQNPWSLLQSLMLRLSSLLKWKDQSMLWKYTCAIGRTVCFYRLYVHRFHLKIKTKLLITQVKKFDLTSRFLYNGGYFLCDHFLILSWFDWFKNEVSI